MCRDSGNQGRWKVARLDRNKQSENSEVEIEEELVMEETEDDVANKEETQDNDITIKEDEKMIDSTEITEVAEPQQTATTITRTITPSSWTWTNF